jgi:metallo-beta-lactamase family protein
MELIFWGATDDVTGSMTYVKLPEGLIAIDCGLAQGMRETERLNDLPLPFPPSDLKAVILTHAHLDHSGKLPLLVKKGFKGSIYCTNATAQLAKIILQDSATLDDQKYYDEDDVKLTLNLIKTVEWHHHKDLLGGSFSLLPAGHILGASSVKLKALGKTVVFSGDLGRKKDPLIPAPPRCPSADIVVMESTYGGKIRTGDLEKELYTFLMKVSREQRIGIIASFAVARGQMLIALIQDFFSRHPEEKIKVVFDSPMMEKANQVYASSTELLNGQGMFQRSLESTESIEYEGQWESLRKKKGPLIIISSSGMLTGGRISRHLKNWQDDERAILFLPGYQAQGTPGRAFLEGERTLKGPRDELIQWSGEVLGSDAFSSHADQTELLDWVLDLAPETKIFLIHGEEKSKDILAQKLKERGHECLIPFRSQSVTLK